jgi:L-alanine-DL-glutamate epimerase-like enolase superfamily enzyme
MYRTHPDFTAPKPVTFQQLQAIMDRPVLDTSRIGSPVVIDSFTLLFCRNMWFLRVRGTDGEEGIAPCTERASYLYPLMEKKTLPRMLGRDARNLEALFHEIFINDDNYKLQGVAYFCCVAWVESAVLDMLAKAADVHVTELLGGRKRNELELYMASGNRHTTPEEEVAVLQGYVDRYGVKAFKFRLGGCMSRNEDSMEGRTEALLYLARKHFGDGFIMLGLL